MNDNPTPTGPSVEPDASAPAAPNASNEVPAEVPTANETPRSSTPVVPQDIEAPTQPIVAESQVGVVPSQQPVVQKSVEPKKKKQKGILIGSIIAATLLILGGGGALAYSLWYQNPDKVVHDAVVNAIRAASVSGTGSMTVVSDGFAINLTFDGKTSGVDGAMNVKATIEGENPDDATEKIALSVEGSGVIKGEVIYVRLAGLPKAIDDIKKQMSDGEEVPEYVVTIANKIEGRWISIKPSDYADLSAETSEQQACIARANESLMTKESEVSKELVELYKANQVISATDKLGAKDVGGTASLGYAIDFNVEAAQGFVRGMNETTYGKALKECDDSIDFSEIADAMKSDDEDDVNVKYELWVSRFGHEMTRFSVAGSEDDATIDIVMDPVFNAEVTVDAPEDTISIKDLMDDISEAVMGYYMDSYDATEYYYDEDAMVEFEQEFQVN